jgi:hypothetical protein
MRNRDALTAMAITAAAVIGALRVGAQEATPVIHPASLTLVEHADRVTSIDLGAPGPSVATSLSGAPIPSSMRPTRSTPARRARGRAPCS